MKPAPEHPTLGQVELGRSFDFPSALLVTHKERVEGFRAIFPLQPRKSTRQHLLFKLLIFLLFFTE